MATIEIFFLHCLTLKIKVKCTFAWLFLSLAMYMTDLIYVSILTFPRSRISKNNEMNFLTSTVDLVNQGHTTADLENHCHTHIWYDLA